ncbi:MAG: SPOR domain-containing protein [Candidatus Tokpelaia sp.]|nr:MAG: SPOR domain-containing protein [Candidatus Tokpelaia sp.]KAA6207543.1 MAG: SPOR domain-containing protein [Candidatus Tokpelaia sp.]
MNFDRKSGNNSGKVAEGSNTFPELPRMFGGKAQNGFSGRNLPADQHDFAGDEYPSGAFPALDIAYPDQTIHDAGGSFVSDNNTAEFEADFQACNEMSGQAFGAGQAEPYNAAPPNNPYQYDNSAAGRPGSAFYADEQYETYMPQQEIYNPANEARGRDLPAMEAGEQGFAGRNGYAHQSFAPEARQDIYSRHDDNAYGQSRPQYAAVAESYSDEAPYAPDPAQGEPGMTERYFVENNNIQGGRAVDDDSAESGLQDRLFAEETFHSGLNEGALLQPARFEPSDYDYDYDYNAPAEEPAMPGLAAEEREYPAVNAYERQDFMSPAQAASPRDYDFSDSGNEERNAAAPSAIGQSFSHGYNLQAASYNSGAQPLYYDSGVSRQNSGQFFSAASAGLYREQGMAPAQSEKAGGDFAAAGFAYADIVEEPPYNTGDEAPLPFIEDEEEDNFAADFARLKADTATINEAAGGGIAGDFEEIAASRPARAERSKAAIAAVLADSAAPAPKAQPGGIQAAAHAGGQNFAADAAYGDGLYDWAAPAAVPPAPYKRKPLPVQGGKGKKIILLVAVFIILLLAGAGLYWVFSGRQAAYSGGPVIIHKAVGDYKVKPDNSAVKAANNQEQSVAEGVSGDNAAQNQQEMLIDKTEAPVEMQKMEERLPFSDEGSFDQSSVDSLVKSVVARATPVHIIPSVRVGADRKIIASAGRDTEKVLLPGAQSSFTVKQGHKQNQVDNKNALAPPAAAASSATAPPPVKPAERVASPVQKTAAAKADSAQMAAAAVGGNFYMQISSQPSKEAAEQSIRMAKKYLSEDTGRRIVIVPALIPNKGTYYRVRIQAESREAAAHLCEEYKQAGGTCFVAQ